MVGAVVRLLAAALLNAALDMDVLDACGALRRHCSTLRHAAWFAHGWYHAHTLTGISIVLWSMSQGETDRHSTPGRCHNAGLLPMRAPPFDADQDDSWYGSAPASPSWAAEGADQPGLQLRAAESGGPSEELIEALCSLPQLPTLPVTTVRPATALPFLLVLLAQNKGVTSWVRHDYAKPPMAVHIFEVTALLQQHDGTADSTAMAPDCQNRSVSYDIWPAHASHACAAAGVHRGVAAAAAAASTAGVWPSGPPCALLRTRPTGGRFGASPRRLHHAAERWGPDAQHHFRGYHEYMSSLSSGPDCSTPNLSVTLSSAHQSHACRSSYTVILKQQAVSQTGQPLCAGVWCDALPALVLDQWRHARESLLNLRTLTAGAAVQAWLVDKQAQVCPIVCTTVVGPHARAGLREEAVPMSVAHPGNCSVE